MCSTSCGRCEAQYNPIIPASPSLLWTNIDRHTATHWCALAGRLTDLIGMDVKANAADKLDKVGSGIFGGISNKPDV